MKKNALILFTLLLSLTLTTPAFCEEEDDEITQRATTYYNNAIDLYKQNNISKSINYFEKALELKPDFYEAHYNLSQILMSLNKYDEAIKSLEKIAHIKPNDSENLYNLGKMYYKKGYLSNAYENLKKIAVNDIEYDSAKLLLSKIEMRQNELNLEEKINQHHNITDLQGKAKAVELGEFQAPSGISADEQGNIYVASYAENRIYKISSFGQRSLLSRTNLVQGPISLVLDSKNNIYVANYGANNIVKITPEGDASIFADVKKPYCLYYDYKHNRLYATEQDTNKLLKFDL